MKTKKKKKKGFRPKISSNSGCRLKILANLEVLGLDLHSSSPETVNFFVAQSSLGGAQCSFGGAQAVIWGGHGPVMLPVAPGLFPTLTTSNNFPAGFNIFLSFRQYRPTFCLQLLKKLTPKRQAVQRLKRCFNTHRNANKQNTNCL